MGLQLWMPMIGNINNQGLSNLSYLSGSYVKGTCSNFGLCLNVPNSTPISFTVDGLVNAKKFSVCFWTLADNSTKADWNQMLMLGDKKTDGSWGSNFRFESCKTYPRACSFHNNDIYAITAASRILGSSYNTWYHVCVTYDGTELKSYINGNLIGTDVGNGGYLTGYVQIGSANYFGLMNDLRIYDELISQKQLNDILKRQIIHYPLNNLYELGVTNKYSGDIAAGSFNTNGIVKTQLSNERGYNYKLTYISDGNNAWACIGCSDHPYSFTPGKRYHYSCKVRCNSKSNVIFYFRAARASNDWDANQVNVIPSADGKWHEYSTSTVVNSTFSRDGSTVTSAPIVEFYTGNMNTSGTSYSFDIDIKDVQVIEEYGYSFIANELVTTTVSDISGYCNNANESNVSYSNSVNSPRYDACYHFPNNGYMKFRNPLYDKGTIYELTINMWVRINTGGGYCTVLSAYDSPINGFPWIGLNTEGSCLWSYIASNSPNYGQVSNSNLSTNTWYMITYIFNNGNVYWYLNGSRIGDVTKYTTNYISVTDEYLALGNSYTGTNWDTKFDGYISDFRMFISILSDSEVKNLYQNATTLTSSGQLMPSGEVIEV